MTGDPGQLAQVIARLFAASRTDGKQRTHVCSHGLQLRVGTAEGEFIALSRKVGEPDMQEAQTVAAKAGWDFYSADWQSIGGRRYLWFGLTPRRSQQTRSWTRTTTIRRVRRSKRS